HRGRSGRRKSTRAPPTRRSSGHAVWSRPWSGDTEGWSAAPCSTSAAATASTASRWRTSRKPVSWARISGCRCSRPRKRAPKRARLGGARHASVRFTRADAATLPFPGGSFAVLLSRSALEHIVPVERALAEMARVVRPGGVIRHAVDPYYWLRGCHKRGLVDIP